MDISEYFARKLFIKAVDWLMRYEPGIKMKKVSAVYAIQKHKVSEMKKICGCKINP